MVSLAACVVCSKINKENIQSTCSHDKTCQADPDNCLSSAYPSPNLTKAEQHSCKKDSWPQIDGSITAMRKHGVVVNIHWYTQLHDITDQSNTTKMIAH